MCYDNDDGKIISIIGNENNNINIYEPYLNKLRNKGNNIMAINENKSNIVQENTQLIDKKINEDKKEIYKYNLNHRKRLMESFLKNPEGMQKYQILELLLNFVIPQKNLRPLAKDLLEKFGSLNGIFHSDIDVLTNFNGIGERTVSFFKCIEQIINLLLKEEIISKQNFPLAIENIAKYCMFNIGHLNYEKVMVFMFDSKRNFIKEYYHSKGTLSYSPMYIRELLVEILNTKSTYIILVHNHPSGNIYPSSPDIAITKKIASILKETEISLYDHLIVSNNAYISMKKLGLF